MIQWFTTAGEPWFTPNEMQKIVAKDAAAGDARKKVEVDYELAAMIKDNLRAYRGFAKSEDIFLQVLYEAKAKRRQKRGQKRSHTEMAETGGSRGRERMLLMSLVVCLKKSEALQGIDKLPACC